MLCKGCWAGLLCTTPAGAVPEGKEKFRCAVPPHSIISSITATHSMPEKPSKWNENKRPTIGWSDMVRKERSNILKLVSPQYERGNVGKRIQT